MLEEEREKMIYREGWDISKPHQSGEAMRCSVMSVRQRAIKRVGTQDFGITEKMPFVGE